MSSDRPTVDQIRLYLQTLQSERPSDEQIRCLELLMSNPDYQRLLSAPAATAAPPLPPIQHPLAPAAANPDNPAFRALIAHSSGASALPFAVYPNFEMHPEMMNSTFFPNGLPFNPYMAGLDVGRRKNATREVTAPLKKWLIDHRKYPYPNKAEKMFLAVMTKMSLTQVSTWFANARRRLKKENKMEWSPRNRPNEEDDDEDRDEDRDDSNGSPSVSALSDPETQSNTETKKRMAENPIDEKPPPLKRKIWSITETLENSKSPEVRKPTPPATPPPSSSSHPAPSFPQPFPLPFQSPLWPPPMMAMFAAMQQNVSRTPNFLQMMAAQQFLRPVPGPHPFPFTIPPTSTNEGDSTSSPESPTLRKPKSEDATPTLRHSPRSNRESATPEGDGGDRRPKPVSAH